MKCLHQTLIGMKALTDDARTHGRQGKAAAGPCTPPHNSKKSPSLPLPAGTTHCTGRGRASTTSSTLTRPLIGTRHEDS